MKRVILVLAVLLVGLALVQPALAGHSDYIWLSGTTLTQASSMDTNAAQPLQSCQCVCGAGPGAKADADTLKPSHRYGSGPALAQPDFPWNF